MVAFARAEVAPDLGERLGEITAPTLVIAGERTPCTQRRSSAGPRTVYATAG
jgi:pimeloyl-ACP methyl ester carboxylesterase